MLHFLFYNGNAFPLHEAVGGKPARTGDDVDAAAKERPEEAPFAVLRPHDYRTRTWNRTPAAKPTCPNKKNNSYNFFITMALFVPPKPKELDKITFKSPRMVSGMIFSSREYSSGFSKLRLGAIKPSRIIR